MILRPSVLMVRPDETVKKRNLDDFTRLSYLDLTLFIEKKFLEKGSETKALLPAVIELLLKVDDKIIIE